jgi:uncharacterized membrane protein
METIIILLIIVLIILYNSSVNSNRQAMEKLQSRLDQLLRETTSLREEVKGLATPKADTASPIVKEPVKPQPKPEPPPQPVQPVMQPPVTPQPQKAERTYKEVAPPKYEPMHIINEETWWQKWLRSNPDLEKFIGENLVNKIGIAILVLGIAFFVKYAIDKNWINEVGRVCIGLFCGMLLTGLAHFLRKSYRSFSSVLAGGGIAVFYFTIAFAFHQYHLLSQTVAFLVMVVITAFAITLSILYNRIELAVIAAVGGFLTPFLVSTGEGNYVVLFTYLVILNSGLLALAFFKRWPLLNVLALFFTELIYGGWLVKSWWEGARNISYPVALAFATAFYLLFLGMNTVYQVKHRLPFKAFDYTLLLLLNGSYFAAGIYLLQQVNNGQFDGLFTAGIGLVNFGLARYFFYRRQSYNTLLYVFIGLTLTFLSLTIPIQLQGHAITLFWSMEAVLLFWLYQRSRIRLFYYASLLVTVLTSGSLLMDWEAAMREPASLVLIYTNLQGLITNIMAATAFALYAFLLTKEQSPLPALAKKKTLLQVYGLAAFCLGYLTAIYGVNVLFRNAENYNVPNVYHRLITEASVAAILVWLNRRKIAHYRRLMTGAVMVYLLYHLFSFAQITGLRNGVLEGRYAVGHWAMHWVSVAAAIALLFTVIQFLQKARLERTAVVRLSWATSLLLLIFFSQEVAHLFVVVAQKTDTIDYLEDQYLKAVLTIVWGLCSFGLMWLGMRKKNKTLRIISLSVFCLALLKLFFFDLANVSEGGKIIAFILLGVLLLTISFMYQRLKKMIINDESR